MTDRTNVKLLLSYDGTDFCGWQKQKDHKCGPDLPSIQETLEIALQKILREPISVSASGRTDAGVHAIGQVAHFHTNRNLPKDICWALRSLLPPTIVVKKAWIAPDEFHSTISATKKTYRYWIWNSYRGTSLLQRYSLWIRTPLNPIHLNEASQYLLKYQDFESFKSKGTPVKHSFREIYSANWVFINKNILEFKLTGNGFMKQMVRNIVGTQLELCLKQKSPGTMKDILEAKDRTKAGPAAPPQGLFLYRVYYPKKLDNRCRQI